MFPVCAPAALERPEGVAQQDYVAMEEFQQRTNAFSLEKVKAYYRRLRYAEPAPSRSSHSGTRETFHLFKIGSSPPLAACRLIERKNALHLHFHFFLLKDTAKVWDVSKVRAASLISSSADVLKVSARVCATLCGKKVWGANWNGNPRTCAASIRDETLSGGRCVFHKVEVV